MVPPAWADGKQGRSNCVRKGWGKEQGMCGGWAWADLGAYKAEWCFIWPRI